MKKSAIKKQIEVLNGDSVQNLEALLTSQSVKTVTANVLILIGIAGAIGLLLTAPNALKLLAPFLRHKYRRPLRHAEQREKLINTYYYLKKSGQVIFKEKDGKLFAHLSRKGRQRLTGIANAIRTIPRPLRWSGTWWLVAGDIPTKEHRIGADMLRIKLRELRFYSLQRTLWIHPFDPRDALAQIVSQYQIARFVTVMEITRLDIQDEQKLRLHFKYLQL